MKSIKKVVADSFGNLSIRSKLFLSYALTMLLTLSLGGLILASVIRNAIETSIESELSNSTNTILNLVKSTTNASIKNLLRAIAEKNRDIVYHFYSQYQNGTIDEETAKANARQVLLSQVIGSTGYIYCLNSDGVIKVHPNKELMDVDISQNGFVRKQMLKKEGYIEYDWANPGEDKQRAKALYMVYFKPWDWIISASSYREEFIELLNVEDFEESVFSLRFGTTGYSYIIDRKGNFIIHPTLQGTNIMDYQDASSLKFIRDMIDAKNGSIIYPWKNPGEEKAREKLVIFNYIPELDWIVASSSYLEEFYQPLKTISYTLLVVILATLILVFLTAFFLGKSITRPLYQLINNFKFKTEADFSHRMVIGDGGEIGELASCYNDFMQHLENYHQRLLVSEENFRGIFEGAVEGIFKCTAEGDIVSLNNSLVSMLGYQNQEDLIEKNRNKVFNLFVDHSTGIRLLSVLAEKGSVTNYETRLYKKGGEVIWVALAIRGIEEEGQLNFVEGFVNDISEQKLSEQELMKRQKEIEDKNRILLDQTKELKRLSVIKDDFLAMTTHELRTPLHGIIGIAEAMTDESSQELSPKALSDLGIIISSGRRLSNLLNDLLDSSKLKQKEIILNKKPLDLKKHIDIILNIYRTLTKKPLLFLENQVPDNHNVLADEERLQQILHNLIANATKFSDRGIIRVTSKLVEDMVHISVEDKGIGIDPDKLDDIFLPFEQGDYSSTRKYPGTGLGLSITKQLVELHGGKIWANSSPGKGAIFTFSLYKAFLPATSISQPVAKTIGQLLVENTADPTTTDSQSKQYPEIVVVDDDPVNLYVVCSQLKTSNFKTVEFSSGPEAIDYVMKHPPKLMLLDVMMPKMNGFQVCNIVRETFPLNELPIIFLTAKNQVTDLVQGFSVGANDYLTKPFSKNELVARVQIQMRLLEAKDRLINLRNFNNQIDTYTNVSQLFNQAFQYLVDEKYVQNGVLLSDGKLLASKGNDHKTLQKMSSTIQTDEEVTLNSNGELHLISIRIKGMDSQQIILQTSEPIADLRLEYVRNLVEQIKIIRTSINKLSFDPYVSREIFTIGSLLNDILYVQSAKQYCIIHTEKESIELRLSLKEITLRFREYQLLQVHRSYLVNPEKVSSIVLSKNRKMEVDLKHTKIPVGANYIPTVMDTFPNLIQN